MKFHVALVKAKDLRPGDLFSNAGADYWNGRRDKTAVAEKVYMRTECPCPVDQENDKVYRVMMVDSDETVTV